MRDPARLRDRYAVVGVGLSRFGKVPGVSAMGFCLEASTRAIAANPATHAYLLDKLRDAPRKDPA